MTVKSATHPSEEDLRPSLDEGICRRQYLGRAALRLHAGIRACPCRNWEHRHVSGKAAPGVVDVLFQRGLAADGFRHTHNMGFSSPPDSARKP